MGSDEPPDPLATMMDAAARARKADQTEFDSLVAGIDPAKLTLSPWASLRADGMPFRPL